MKKKPSVCPKCNQVYAKQKVKQPRNTPVQKPMPAPKASDLTKSEEDVLDEELGDDLLEAEDDKAADEAIMEDTSDITEDNEDIGEVIGTVDSSENKD